MTGRSLRMQSELTLAELATAAGLVPTLDDIDVVRVDFPVPERYLAVLRTGQPISAMVDAYGDETFAGRIALIGNAQAGKAARAALR